MAGRLPLENSWLRRCPHENIHEHGRAIKFKHNGGRYPIATHYYMRKFKHTLVNLQCPFFTHRIFVMQCTADMSIQYVWYQLAHLTIVPDCSGYRLHKRLLDQYIRRIL